MPWTEHAAADGRKYWACKETGKSIWEKPDELKTPAELALGDWREYSAPNGRAYYVHRVTKETVWTRPAPTAGAAAVAPPPPPPTAPPPPLQPAATPLRAMPPPPLGPPPPLQPHPQQQPPPAAAGALPPFAPCVLALAPLPTPPSAPPPAPFVPPPAALWPQPLQPQLPPRPPPAPQAAPMVEPPAEQTGATPALGAAERARALFAGLLRESGVTLGESWEAALRRIVHDGRYGLLPTVAERRIAFDAFQQTLRAEADEAQRACDRATRRAFAELLDEHAELLAARTPFSDARAALCDDGRWEAAAALFARTAAQRVRERAAGAEGGGDDGRDGALQREAHELGRRWLCDEYEEWQHTRDAAEREQRRAARAARAGALRAALDALTADGRISVTSAWRDAQPLLRALADDAAAAPDEPRAGSSVPELCAAGLRLGKLEQLALWEEHKAALEATTDEEYARAREEQRRAGRAAREHFRQLLRQMASRGDFAAGVCRWDQALPLVEATAEYAALAAQPAGSTPQELWSDFAEDELRVDPLARAPRASGGGLSRGRAEDGGDTALPLRGSSRERGSTVAPSAARPSKVARQ
ncbi:hypothetical protein KFE25_003204 [Diacronema lutheri]|uniref:WW domain-containing protein n=1 Tax=Diacronema lutheri TaxID=2081491 RepID=A0A8J5XF96_DIALT|nr:hypothetical protein KFE25_003204 [Diacronema lutheri]